MIGLPGFTAEHTLSKPVGHHRLVAARPDDSGRGRVVAQRMRNEVVRQEYIAWEGGCAYICDEQTGRCRLVSCYV